MHARLPMWSITNHYLWMLTLNFDRDLTWWLEVKWSPSIVWACTYVCVASCCSNCSRNSGIYVFNTSHNWSGLPDFSVLKRGKAWVYIRLMEKSALKIAFHGCRYVIRQIGSVLSRWIVSFPSLSSDCAGDVSALCYASCTAPFLCVWLVFMRLMMQFFGECFHWRYIKLAPLNSWRGKGGGDTKKFTDGQFPV